MTSMVSDSGNIKANRKMSESPSLSPEVSSTRAEALPVLFTTECPVCGKMPGIEWEPSKYYLID